MKTENTHNQLTDWQVEQLLKPCFAPSADEIRLPKVPAHRNTRRLWINIARIGGVAAALIVGLFIVFTPNNTVTAKVYDATTQFAQLDKMPTFQMRDLSNFCYWLSSNIKYPQEAIDKELTGKVIFSFIVETDGSLSEFTVLQSPSEILTNEVERVFNTSPKWEAGECNGEKVRVRFQAPISFTLKN